MGWQQQPLKRAYACNRDILIYLRERRGWTQRQLADTAGYTDRLIGKAESGGSIAVETLADIADALTTPEHPVYPEDLICDPVNLAKKYIAAQYEHPGKVVEQVRHFLDDQAVLHVVGDPAVIPFAGEHRGVDAMKRGFAIFYSVIEVPANHDHRPWYRFLCEGNDVVVWGQSWMHPIGQPMEQPMNLVQRLRFQRGKLVRVEVVFDTLEGSRLLNGDS